MNTTQAYDFETLNDPLEWVEGFLSEEGMIFERTPEGDISFALSGDWRTFDLWFSWRPEGEAIQLCCALDVEGRAGTVLDEARLAGLFELLSLINQHVWFGHFELFKDTQPPKDVPMGLYDVVFRLTLPFNQMDQAAFGAFAHMVNTVTETVERFMPAFEFWFKGAMSPENAFAACLFETQGEA
jgi:hypothetical protein